MNTVFALVQVFDMQFDDITNGIVEHEEAGGLFDRVSRLGHVDQIEDGG